MKNKKLYAILTLVAFMITLMPIMAFAAADDGVALPLTVTYNTAGEATFTGAAKVYKVDASRQVTGTALDNLVDVTVKDGEFYAGFADTQAAAVPVTTDTVANVYAVTTATIDAGKDAATVAATVDPQTSSVYTVRNNPSVSANERVKVTFELNNKHAQPVTTGTTENLIIWAQEKGSSVPTTALNGVFVVNEATAAGTATSEVVGGVALTAVTNGATYEISFSRAGEYVIYAAVGTDFDDTGATAPAKVTNTPDKMQTVSTNNTITVDSGTILTSHYGLVGVAGVTTITDLVYFAEITGLEANNVASRPVTLKLVNTNDNNSALKGKEVTINTNSANIEVSKEKVTTNALGQIDFYVTGLREGTYKIYVTCGNAEWVIRVVVGSTAAANIEVTKEPAAPIDLGSTDTGIKMVLTDINGNAIDPSVASVAGDGWNKAATSNSTSASANFNYVSLVEKPSKTKLLNKDLNLVKHDTDNDVFTIGLKGKTLDAEGVYVFKVVLDNGKYATAKVEVKEFQTPVKLVLTYTQEGVELGGTAKIDELRYVDVNGVTKTATGKVSLAATGYAIAEFESSNGDITVKTNEKYVGSEITVTAVDSRYDLVATANLVVADEAREIKFADITTGLVVNANNKIDFQIVDVNGNKVALGTAAAVEDVSFVVLEKPEGAKVSANISGGSNDLLTKGSATMALTSNVKGDVKVQVLVRVNANGVTKYYTGVETFAVGSTTDKTLVDKAVKMVLGEKVFVVDGKMVVGEVAPFAQDNRTYIPVRSFEALGFDVEWNESEPNLVTLTADDTVVVMEIGSNIITINGEATTMDVPALVKDYRTFLPIRFAAEAIGYEFDNAASLNGDIIMTKVK